MQWEGRNEAEATSGPSVLEQLRTVVCTMLHMQVPHSPSICLSVCLSAAVPTWGRTWCNRSVGSSLRGDCWEDRPQRTPRGTAGGQRSWVPGRQRGRRRRGRGRVSLERTWCCRRGGGAAPRLSRSCRVSGTPALSWGTQGPEGEALWGDGCNHGNCCQVERSLIRQ